MPLIMSERHSTFFDDLKKICALKIKNAKNDDSGLYSIVVENSFGSDDSSGQVNVKLPEEHRPKYRVEPEPIAKAPQIIKHFQSENYVDEGQPIILQCIIEGLPLPKVKKLKILVFSEYNFKIIFKLF